MKGSICFIFLFCCTVSFCQLQYKLPAIKEKPFPVYIEDAFRNNFTKRLDTIGLNGFCWIKFKVDVSGNLQRIEISPGTHPVLSAFIKETLLTTNGLWEFKAGIEWLVLPFRYTLQKNGKTEQATIDPYQLEEFLPGENGMYKEMQYTFLPVQEFESPFDGEKNFKRMKLQQAGKRE